MRRSSLVALPLREHFDSTRRLRPLARHVDQVPTISSRSAVAAKPHAFGSVDVDCDGAVMMDLFHGAGERGHRRAHVR